MAAQLDEVSYTINLYNESAVWSVQMIKVQNFPRFSRFAKHEHEFYY